jgi:hypothetical protein
VRKHRSNPRYFKGKKLQNKIFNQLNIKKVKLTKIKKKYKKKVKKKKHTVNYYYNQRCIGRW